MPDDACSNVRARIECSAATESTCGFVEEPVSSPTGKRSRDGGSSAWAPVTVWQTYTDPVRLVEIRHTDLTVRTEDQACAWAECLDLRAVLHADGRLELLFREGRAREVAAHDVRVRWPAGDRYAPFPEALMPKRRARPPATPSAAPDHAVRSHPGITALPDHAPGRIV